MNKNILLIGNCGVGKTWVMKNVLMLEKTSGYCIGKFYFQEGDKIIVVGKYDGTTFEGSDRLSMSVITDVERMKKYLLKKNKIAFFEGDRFTNNRFISTINPTIIRIKGDGAEGRIKRGSNQTQTHLKRIATRVSNIKSNIDFNSSLDCFNYLKEFYEKN